MTAPLNEGGPSQAAAGAPKKPVIPTEVKETAEHVAQNANSVLNGVSDALGLTERVQKAPYLTVAAALGIGYVVGGGLFTPTTMRLMRIGLKLAAIPPVRERLLDLAEEAVDSMGAAARGDDYTPGS